MKHLPNYYRNIPIKSFLRLSFEIVAKMKNPYLLLITNQPERLGMIYINGVSTQNLNAPQIPTKYIILRLCAKFVPRQAFMDSI